MTKQQYVHTVTLSFVNDKNATPDLTIMRLFAREKLLENGSQFLFGEFDAAALIEQIDEGNVEVGNRKAAPDYVDQDEYPVVVTDWQIDEIKERVKVGDAFIGKIGQTSFLRVEVEAASLVGTNAWLCWAIHFDGHKISEPIRIYESTLLDGRYTKVSD